MNRISNCQEQDCSQEVEQNKEFQTHIKYAEPISFKGFNIIELDEDIEQSKNLNADLLSEREIVKLKTKAKSIEEYYISNFDKDKISENCFNCLMNNFHPNELLYFTKRKDLLLYFKYCFYFMKKNLFLDEKIYIENKYELEKCDSNYLNGWKFFIPKTICRACFLKILNMKGLFANLKNIFSDIDSNDLIFHEYRKRSHHRLRYSHDRRKNGIDEILQKEANGRRG